jgi:DNA-binding Xre family transcriptional regulator
MGRSDVGGGVDTGGEHPEPLSSLTPRLRRADSDAHAVGDRHAGPLVRGKATRFSVRTILAELRFERGLSQVQLAAAAGMTTQAVMRWERGEISGMPFRHLVYLGAALGVKPAELVPLLDSVPPASAAPGFALRKWRDRGKTGAEG